MKGCCSMFDRHTGCYTTTVLLGGIVVKNVL